MADEADLGNDAMDRWLQGRLEDAAHYRALAEQQEQEEEHQCRNCQEPLPSGRHYCDQDCRDDWEERLRAERRRGRMVE